ncbi:MAG: hypothetical protein E6J64_04340 [Deltaproteobacteria bacterium]|nr:MAG: hypothetical protein E6J64_04340 [Deltaproteobacteria bacterium]
MLALLLLFAAAPAERAKDVAARLPIARSAMREVHLAAAAISDQPLRAAVEAMVMAPWLPPESYAVAHPAEAERMLQEAGLLEGRLQLPPQRGSFQAACGGDHHAYPGGLSVHAWAAVLHARGLAAAYQQVYGVKLRDEWLVAAALWHDALKAATLPWRDDATCGPEPRIAGTGAHHVLALAAAIVRRLPDGLVLTIASAHAPVFEAGAKQVCGFLRAASIIANGKLPAAACPASAPPEAFAMNTADADDPLTTTAGSWYAERAPKGWERFEAMIQDGSDVAAWARAQRY